MEGGWIYPDCLCSVSFYQIAFRLPFKSTNYLKNKMQENDLLLEPLQKHNKEGNAKFDSLYPAQAIPPVTSQTDGWESTRMPISSSPWSTRRGRNQVAWWGEVALIWLRWCYPIASTPVPSPCPAALAHSPSSLELPSPLSSCQLSPSRHTLTVSLFYGQGFCRAMCSGVAWVSSGMSGLQATLGSQTNEAASSLCRFLPWLCSGLLP